MFHLYEVCRLSHSIDFHVRTGRACDLRAIVWWLETDRLKEQSCAERHLRKSSTEVLQAVTAYHELHFCQVKNKNITLKWASYSSVNTIGYLRSGRKVPPVPNIGFCCDMLMAGWESGENSTKQSIYCVCSQLLYSYFESKTNMNININIHNH